MAECGIIRHAITTVWEYGILILNTHILVNSDVRTTQACVSSELWATLQYMESSQKSHRPLSLFPDIPYIQYYIVHPIEETAVLLVLPEESHGLWGSWVEVVGETVLSLSR